MDAQVDLEVVAEGGLDQVALVLPQQAVVDEDADELVADGLVQQGGDDGRIDAAATGRRSPWPSPTCSRTRRTVCSTKLPIVHVPAAVADLVEEVLEDLLAARRVGDLGVELHAVERPGACAGRRRRGRWAWSPAATNSAGSSWTWSPWLIQTVVSSGRPWTSGSSAGDVQLGPAVLARLGRLHLPAEDLRPELHAVADAEDRDAEVEDARVAARGVGLVNAARAAGEDQALGVELLEFVDGDVGPDQLAVDALLADPAGDELGVLRAEIEDRDDFVVLHWEVITQPVA